MKHLGVSLDRSRSYTYYVHRTIISSGLAALKIMVAQPSGSVRIDYAPGMLTVSASQCEQFEKKKKNTE